MRYLADQKLKAFVDEHVRHDQAREICFVICGERFVETFYPTILRVPHILVEPYMSTSVQQNLMQEFRRRIVTFMDVNPLEEFGSKSCLQLEDAVDQLYRRYIGAFIRPAVMWQTTQTTEEEGRRPNDTSGQSEYERTGDAMANILQTNARLCHEEQHRMFKLLKGRCMPKSVRQYLWRVKLRASDIAVSEMHSRMEKLAQVAQVMNPRESAISKLLDQVIHETLSTSLRFVVITRVLPHLHQALAEVLNQYYILTKTQSRNHIYLLVPFLQVFPDVPTFGSGHFLYLLDTMVTSVCYRGNVHRGELHAASQSVVKLLQERDLSLYNKLQQLESGRLKTSVGGSQDHHAERFDMREICAKWLSTGLVSVLSTHALLFVWDQCWLSPRGWKVELEWFCSDVWILSRDEILPDLRQNDLSSFEQHVLAQTSRLTTRSLRQCFQQRHTDK